MQLPCQCLSSLSNLTASIFHSNLLKRSEFRLEGSRRIGVPRRTVGGAQRLKLCIEAFQALSWWLPAEGHEEVFVQLILPVVALRLQTAWSVLGPLWSKRRVVSVFSTRAPTAPGEAQYKQIASPKGLQQIDTTQKKDFGVSIRRLDQTAAFTRGHES